MVSSVSLIQTAAMMFSLCAIIAPAVANRDERSNRLQPTEEANYCSFSGNPCSYTHLHISATVHLHISATVHFMLHFCISFYSRFLC